MKRIIYVPLDERPCNKDFPMALSLIADNIELIVPPIELMGNKKSPANIEGLWDFLLNTEADGYILSLDMLIYGGILPSRLHNLSVDQCIERLERLRLLSSKPLFAFELLMRCPQYSSSDEEPDYYAECGREIFRSGYLLHKKELNIADDDELDELKTVENMIPSHYLADYLDRRKKNIEVNTKAIELVAEGIIDFLIIPQDDSAPFGYTAKDQQIVRSAICSNNVSLKVYMYPGADEVGCTLLARMVNKINNKVPKIYPKYASTAGMSIIPHYEDRPVHETVKYHILAAGGVVTNCESDADILFCINSPGKYMREACQQHSPSHENDVSSNLVEFVEYCAFALEQTDKAVVVGDIAYANGADLKLVKLMKQRGILYRINGYAGWNTSSNTLGTCLCQGVLTRIYGKVQSHLNFLAMRYVEDAGYCSFARAVVSENAVEMGYCYTMLDGKRGNVSKLVKDELESFVKRELSTDEGTIVLKDVFMPWNRMFEVGMSVEYIGR